MDQLSSLAASGLRSRMESLDMLANNLANSTTAGYKADREFYSLFVGEGAGMDSGDPLASKSPVIEKPWIDFSQGLLQSTGNPTDLALSGSGFLSVKGPSGLLYTRGGSFRLSTTGNLTTKEGYALLGDGGQPIQLDPRQPFTVTATGAVQQNGVSAGKVSLLKFADDTVLAKQGGAFYKNTNEKAIPSPAVNCDVHQGKIEASNVGSAETAARLVGVLRQFEVMQKAIGASTDMDKKSIEEVARV